MTDFARLIMTADASGLKQGERALDSLAAKGEQTEKRVTTALDKTGKKAKEAGGKLVELGKDADKAKRPVDQLGKEIDDLGDKARKAKPPLTELPEKIDDTGKQAANANARLQKFGWQLGQVTQQGAVTGNYLQALAVQMGDILPMLGIGGAAGVAVMGAAILAPVIGNMLSGADAADTMADAVDRLTEAQDALGRSLSIATAPLSELVETYGAAAIRVRELALVQTQLNVAAAQGALAQNINDLSDATEKYTNINSAWASQSAKAFDAIEKDFGLTGAAAAEFVTKLKAVEEQTNSKLQMEQFGDLVDWLAAAGIELEDMPPEMAAAAAAMVDVNIKTEELEALIRRAKGATEEWSGVVSAAGDATLNLADIASSLAPMFDAANAATGGLLGTLNAAATAAWNLAQGRAAIYAQGETNGMELGQLGGFDVFSPSSGRVLTGLGGGDPLATPYSAPDYKAPPKGRKGGKGKSGGKKERENEYERASADIQGDTAAFLRQADALAKVTAAGGDWEHALAVIEQEQNLLNAAQKAGVKINENVRKDINEMAEAYVTAEENLEQMRNATEKGQDAMRDFFGSILDGVDSAKDALAQLLEQIAEVQFAKGALGLLGGTSWGSTLIEGVGRLLSFDGGGYTGNGQRIGGVDGMGGRMAIIHPQETIIDHTKGQSAGGGVWRVEVVPSPYFDAKVSEISDASAARAAGAVRNGVRDQIRQYQLNPRKA